MEGTTARERLQAIIDWADIALKNPLMFAKSGIRNLDGPIFDDARDYLATAEDGALADALDLLNAVHPKALWCVGNMEDGPFCRLVVSDGSGGYIGGEVLATGETPAIAVLRAVKVASKPEGRA